MGASVGSKPLGQEVKFWLQKKNVTWETLGVEGWASEAVASSTHQKAKPSFIEVPPRDRTAIVVKLLGKMSRICQQFVKNQTAQAGCILACKPLELCRNQSQCYWSF